MSAVWDALLGLGDKLAAHVLLAAAALALGIAVALPLAVWASRSATVSRIALGFASLVQTIPALALLALFFPILLSLRAVFGEGLPTLGFLPALLALALYALLPILRNAVTAREQMAPGVLEAADGVGMTPGQKLRLVEAPLAAPYIMAGIRTAAVGTIGAAEPRRSDLRRVADAELVTGVGRLHRLGRACACRGYAARRGRTWLRQPQARTAVGRPRGSPGRDRGVRPRAIRTG